MLVSHVPNRSSFTVQLCLMLKNYFKIAFRHISRNKSYVFINIIGLGIALACCIISFVNYQYVYKADSEHVNGAQIFRVGVDRVGSGKTNVDVKAPLMPNAVAEISNIREGVRFNGKGVVIQSEDKVFSEYVWYADPNVFDVFTFPLIKGDKNGIKDPTKIYLSEKMAKKYFGDANPIGMPLKLFPGEAWQKDLIVAGVTKDFEMNSSFHFDFLTHISFSEAGSNPDTLSYWRNNLAATFLVLNNPDQADEVANDLKKFVAVENAALKDDVALKYRLQPMNLVYREGDGEYVHNNRLNNAMVSSFYWGPALMALLILLTACLNFTNTTISFSNKRLKEMGVRKVMGGGRSQLVGQLLGESFIICFLALLVGVFLAEFLTPLYNQMWSYMNLNLALNYWDSPDLVLFLVGVTLLTALIGGAYPAFYISSFKASHIFRGVTSFGGDRWLVKSLLGLQIIISLVSIIGGITFAQNAKYQETADLGYDVKGVINVEIKSENIYEQFKNSISENPDIQGVAGSLNNLGFGNWWNSLGKPEDNRWVQVHFIGDNFFKVMGIDFLEGRPFDKNRALDYENTCIITQKLMEQQQWDSGLGKTIEMYDKEFEVIGVVENIMQSGFFDTPSPGVYHFKKPEAYRVLKVKVNPEKLVATNDYLKEKWTAAYPLSPYVGYYQDKVLEQSITINKSITWLQIFLSIVSILLAATGLYSLVSLNLLKRAKEIAIRRVVGASPENIAYIINKHYIVVFLVGGILGAIGGAYMSNILMGSIFKVHIGVNTLSTILAVIGVCLVGAFTIGGKLISVLRTNPAETLKSE